MGENQSDHPKTAVEVSTSSALGKQQSGGASAEHANPNPGSGSGDGGSTVKNNNKVAVWVHDNIIVPVKPKRNSSAAKVVTIGTLTPGATGTTASTGAVGASGARGGTGEDVKEKKAPADSTGPAPNTLTSKEPASSSTALASATPAPSAPPKAADGERKDPLPEQLPKPPDPVETLKKAILNGKNSQVQKVLQGHPNLVNEKIGSHVGTAVHYVIRNGNGNKGTERERLDLLRIIDTVSGVDWNATDRSKRTPLHLACSHTRNYGEIAEFLLDHGANPNLLDDTECSPLHDTVTEGQKDMVSLLLGDPRTKPSTPGHNQRTALHKAAYRGHLDIATRLLRNDPDIVDLKDGDGFTPLHDASRQNKPETVEKLIEAGADVNARTKSGATPLHLAASSNAVEAAKVLLRADAWTFFTNNAKETPEKVAERKGHTAMLEILRIPMDVDAKLVGGGKELHVSEPTLSQQTASKQFDGFIWPSIDGHSKYDKPSVFDMLYAEEPKVKKVEKDKDVRWIHIPSNNRIWIEDVFKHVFSSDKPANGDPGTGENNGKAKTHDVQTPEQAENLRSLKEVLHFINSQLSEFDTSSLYRHPHFKISYGNRPGNPKFQMFSIMFPVIDADMQQPVYFDPNPTPPFESNPASKADGEMDDKQKDRASKLEELGQAYPGTPSKCRTLDGYMHEFIDETDLNFRNGDQVVSRFVERIRCDTWRSRRPSQQLTVVSEEPVKGETGARRRKRRNSSNTIAPNDSGPVYDKTDSRYFKAHGSELLKPSGPVVAVAEGTWEKSTTPSQLENQSPAPRAQSRRVLASRIWQHLRNMLAGHVRSELKQLPPLTMKGLKERIAEPDIQKRKDEDESVDSGDDDEDGAEPEDKCIRQQILTVPQLWLLAVGGIVVTSFPEGWRVTDGSTLPQAILRTVLLGRSSNSRAGMMPAAGLINDIVMAALEFEPSISTFGSNRSFLDAFGVEVAFVSSKVTKCYENFKTTLGKTIKIFPDAIKQETELLVRVDDIVNEISMIKRVQQDQDHVCVSMCINQAQRGLSNKKKGKAGNSGDWDNRTSMNAQHERAIERGMNDMRSPRSQHVMARLERLEEDALRVRKSIITLLDLRQRQATTENAISSGRQSDLLFAQSKVLFVFTAATVIFAPLSWVSSLMALNIDQFSPAKDESWAREGVFGASFSSVVCTLLLCIAAWAAYDWRVKKKDRKAEAKENAERQGS